MSITDKTADVLLFTPGRTPCTGPLAIVLHGYSSGIEMLDLEMERCPRPRPRQSTGCHTSFHYGVDGCNIHQYVALANTAWGFGVTPPTCPAPICPPDECASCTGLTVAQYNPDLDGNDPVLPAFVAGTDGTANSCVIHVAVTGQSGFSALDAYGDCCRWMEKSYQCFVRSLCQIFEASGLTPSQTTLLVHCQELLCIDIDQLVLDILACLNAPAPVLPPCNCTATTIAPEAVCAALDTLPVSGVAATIVLGNDCEFHPLPAPVDINVVALDTATINTTVTEGPANTFTVSADLIAVTQTAFCDVLAAIPAGGPAVEGVVLLGNDCLTHSVIATNIVGQDSASIDITLTESTTDNFEILADVIISQEVDNALVLNLDGLYVPTPVNRTEVLVLPDVGTITQATLELNNASTVIITGDLDGQVVIEPPTPTQYKHLWLKNATAIQLEVISLGGALIDGVATITLDGTIPVGYPYDNNGGEAVHLAWAGTAWYIV